MYQLKVKMLESECWWGGTSTDGVEEPFNKRSEIERNLHTQGSNQTMPMYLSTFGRCIWSEEPFKIRFQSGVITVEGESEIKLETYGNTLKEAYRGAMNAHFPPNGERIPEAFFKAPQYNTWMVMTYDQTQEGVIKYAEEIIQNGFKPGVLMIDEGWQKTYGDWSFDLGKFPNPKGMVEKLHEMGFKVMLWVTPNVSPNGRFFIKQIFPEFNPEHYDEVFLRTEGGQCAMIGWWNGYSAILDFNKECDSTFLKNQLDKLVAEIGIDGFKFDGGTLAMYNSDALGGVKVNTDFTPAQRNIAWNEFGRQYPYHEYKDTFKGGGKRVVQRMRDRMHRWKNEGIDTIIPNAIAQGLLGHPFICPDMVGGGDWIIKELGDAFDAELFVRMAQSSALFPMMQFSWEPWNVLDNEHLKLVKEAHDLHVRFAKEMLAFVEEAYRTGEPILRSLEYNYPHVGYEKVTDVFMLGEKYLVAPVLEKGQKIKEIPLPEGKWESWNGETYEGGRTIEVKVTLADLPYFKKI